MSIKFYCCNITKDKAPKRGTKNSVGVDLYLPYGINLTNGELAKIPLGIISSIPIGGYAEIREKSGLASFGIEIKGGIIDCDYRGEWQALVRYNKPTKYIAEYYWLNAGEKIAQVIFHPDPWAEIEIVDDFGELDIIEGNERVGGFGSTDFIK